MSSPSKHEIVHCKNQEIGWCGGRLHDHHHEPDPQKVKVMKLRSEEMLRHVRRNIKRSLQYGKPLS